MEKMCKLCGEIKDVREFNRCPATMDGLSVKCRDCIVKERKRIEIIKSSESAVKKCHICKRLLPIAKFSIKSQFKSNSFYNKTCNRCLVKARQKRRAKDSLEVVADFENILGGYRMRSLNYAKKGEFKHEISGNGLFFQTNDKNEFITKLQEILK